MTLIKNPTMTWADNHSADKDLIEKWGPTRLLEGLPDEWKRITVIALENQAKSCAGQADWPNIDIEQWASIAFPVVRKVFYKTPVLRDFEGTTVIKTGQTLKVLVDVATAPPLFGIDSEIELISIWSDQLELSILPKIKAFHSMHIDDNGDVCIRGIFKE